MITHVVTAPRLQVRGPLSALNPTGPRCMFMKLINESRPRLPLEDYSIALRKAINWLGERYVLAVPVKPHTPNASDYAFFRERRPWNKLHRRQSS